MTDTPTNHDATTIATALHAIANAIRTITPPPTTPTDLTNPTTITAAVTAARHIENQRPRINPDDLPSRYATEILRAITTTTQQAQDQAKTQDLIIERDAAGREWHTRVPNTEDDGS